MKGFKWYVPIGEKIHIPFAKGLYMMGVYYINASINQGAVVPAISLYNKLLHVSLDPNPFIEYTWFKDEYIIPSIFSFINRSDIGIDFGCNIKDIDYITLPITPNQATSIELHILDEEGKMQNITGYCVLHMIKKDSPI